MRRLTQIVVVAVLAVIAVGAMRDVGRGTHAAPDIRFMIFDSAD